MRDGLDLGIEFFLFLFELDGQGCDFLSMGIDLKQELFHILLDLAIQVLRTSLHTYIFKGLLLPLLLLGSSDARGTIFLQ